MTTDHKLDDFLRALWRVYGETPFSTSSVKRKVALPTDERAAALNLLEQMSATGDTRNGYRVKRVASTFYKLIKTQSNESDCPKGLTKESLTGDFEPHLSAEDGKPQICTEVHADLLKVLNR